MSEWTVGNGDPPEAHIRDLPAHASCGNCGHWCQACHGCKLPGPPAQGPCYRWARGRDNCGTCRWCDRWRPRVERTTARGGLAGVSTPAQQARSTGDGVASSTRSSRPELVALEKFPGLRFDDLEKTGLILDVGLRHSDMLVFHSAEFNTVLPRILRKDSPLSKARMNVDSSDKEEINIMITYNHRELVPDSNDSAGTGRKRWRRSPGRIARYARRSPARRCSRDSRRPCCPRCSDA